MPRGRHSASRREVLRTEFRERVLEDLERIQHLVLRIATVLFPGPKRLKKETHGLSSLSPLPSGFRSFGARVRFLRSAKGLTLEQVARTLGTQKGYVSGIETGHVRPPSPRFIAKFA